jgi:hypothetical protein
MFGYRRMMHAKRREEERRQQQERHRRHMQPCLQELQRYNHRRQQDLQEHREEETLKRYPEPDCDPDDVISSWWFDIVQATLVHIALF